MKHFHHNKFFIVLLVFAIFTSGFFNSRQQKVEASPNDHSLLSCSLALNINTPSLVSASDNTYSLSGTVTITGSSTADLRISVVGGPSKIFTAPVTGTINFTVAGLYADSATHTLEAGFVDESCATSITYTAPTAVSGSIAPLGATVTRLYNGPTQIGQAVTNFYSSAGFVGTLGQTLTLLLCKI